MTERYEENSKRTKRVEANSVVLAHLMLPKPEEVPVLERTDLAQQQFLHVTDRGHGWTADGEYI